MKERWISGRPVTFATRLEVPWRDSIIKRLDLDDEFRYTGAKLNFILSSFAPNGHPLDIDNLCEPVFFALTKIGYFHSRRTNIRWWRASKEEGNPSGVLITLNNNKPGPLNHSLGDPIFDEIYIGALPKGGKDTQIPEWLDSLPDVPALDSSDRLALGLYFGSSNVNIGNISTGVVKSMVDCLYPVIGGRAGAPDDWKIDLLHVEKECLTQAPDTVNISIWKIHREHEKVDS